MLRLDHCAAYLQVTRDLLYSLAAEMALHVLAYNMTRVMNIMGTKPLIAAMRA